MQVLEFRSKIKANIKLSIEGRDFTVKEVIKFRLDDGSMYVKCFLSDDFVFADDLNGDLYLLVKEVKTKITSPFPTKLNFDGKSFDFLFEAHAMAEDIQGVEIFKKGDSESFWDYKAEDDSYLSLGIVESTGKRLDFYGKIIAETDVNL